MGFLYYKKNLALIKVVIKYITSTYYNEDNY